MPRKTKDEEVKKITTKKVKKPANIEVEEKSTSIKKASKTTQKQLKAEKKEPAKKVATKKSSSSKTAKATVEKKPTKKASAKKETTKAKTGTSKSVVKKETASKTKKSTTKSTVKKETVSKVKKSTTKSAVKKETTSKASTKKATTTPKTTTKKSSTKKTTTRKTTKKAEPITTTEYYDLPTNYNRTIVKILAQTPSSLFVYWEISEDDRLKLQKQYGEQFFSNTRPYLVITNETMNYSFEVEVNDYANSWYVHVNDSDCKYAIQLIRKTINYNVFNPNSPISIISSNEISAPNDHILFDRLGKTVFFKDVKTSHISQKDISSLAFISNIGRIYNVYDLYKQIYKNELNGDELGVNLSSSGFSSTFK